MARDIKIRTKASEGGMTDILVLLTHPMETGLRNNPDNPKEKLPAHFIQDVTVTLNGKEIAHANFGTAVSKDPLMSLRVKNAKAGDKVKISWKDNKGETGEQEAAVS